MKQDKAEREIRSFAGDWCACRTKEVYTSDDVEDCRAELSAQRPELLEFDAAGKEELARAWITEALEQEGRYLAFKRRRRGDGAMAARRGMGT